MSKLKTSIAFSYIRFSTPEQKMGDSLRRQTEATKAWCERNKATLDTSREWHDKGRSAFKGGHRSNPDRNALAAFLKLVEDGKVRRGSFLVIEALDRLTREHIRPALTLLLNLIEKGVRVVQLKPVEQVYDENVEPMQLMMAIMELSRGHGESARKSDLVGQAWAAKREAARRGEPQPAKKQNRVNGMMLMTHKVPAWIEERGGKLHLIPARAAAVKRIFKMAAAGYGHRLTAVKLNKDKVPSFGAKGWDTAYIGYLLSDGRARGYFQPSARGNPDEEPIPNYYPAAVTEDEWLRARAAAKKRRTNLPGQPKGKPWTAEEDQLVRSLTIKEATERTGRKWAAVCRRRGQLKVTTTREKSNEDEGKHINIFAKMLKNALVEGDTYFSSLRPPSNGRGSPRRLLMTGEYNSGRTSSGLRSFPLETFERAILSQLNEIDPSDILGQKDEAPDQLTVLKERLDQIQEKKAELEAELLNGDVAALARVLRQLEGEERDLTAEIQDVSQKASNPLSESWRECKSLLTVLDKAPDQRDARLRLRAALRRIVDSIYLLVVPKGHYRLAQAQVRFTGGAYRYYTIIHRPPKSNGKPNGRQEGRWFAASTKIPEGVMVQGGPDDESGMINDLTNPDEVTCREEYLESLDTDDLEWMLSLPGSHPLK